MTKKMNDRMMMFFCSCCCCCAKLQDTLQDRCGEKLKPTHLDSRIKTETMMSSGYVLRPLRPSVCAASTATLRCTTRNATRTRAWKNGPTPSLHQCRVPLDQAGSSTLLA